MSRCGRRGCVAVAVAGSGGRCPGVGDRTSNSVFCAVEGRREKHRTSVCVLLGDPCEGLHHLECVLCAGAFFPCCLEQQCTAERAKKDLSRRPLRGLSFFELLSLFGARMEATGTQHQI